LSGGDLTQKISSFFSSLREEFQQYAKVIASLEDLGNTKGQVVLSFGVSGVGFLKIEAYIENAWKNLQLNA